MFRLAAILFLLLMGNLLSAQDAAIRVKSGEHPGFTRLVMKLPEGSGWQLHQLAGRARILLEGGSQGFDLTTVFSRISRQRIGDVSTDDTDGALVLDLRCACDVSAFVEAGQFLVIDVKDARRPGSAPTLFPLVGAQRPYRFEGLAPAMPAFPLPVDEGRRQKAAPVTLARPETLRSPVPAPSAKRVSGTTGARDPAPPPLADLLRKAESRMLDHIDLAARQGILESNPATEPGPKAVVGISGRDTQESANTGALGVAFETATGAALAGSPEARHDQVPGRCTAGEIADFGQDADGSSFAGSVADWRAAILQDPGGFQDAALLSLAEQYIRFGFGAEARSVLTLMQQPSRRAAYLGDIAHILERGPLPDGSRFAGLQKCADPSALWAALAEGNLAEDADRTAILDAFSRWPMHLKLHLGQDLSELFLAAGAQEDAGTIMRLVRRTEHGDWAMKETEASLAEASGDAGQAQRLRYEVIGAGREAGVPGMLELVESARTNNRPLHPDIPGILGSYAFQLRDTEFEAALLRAEAMARSMTGDLQGAREVLAGIKTDFTGTEYAGALDPVVQIATEMADDVDFLRMAFFLGENDLALLSPSTRAQLTRRLAKLGFPDVPDDETDPVKTDRSPPAASVATTETGGTKPREEQAARDADPEPGELAMIARARTVRDSAADLRTRIMEIVK